jgi:hypothetical protein
VGKTTMREAPRSYSKYRLRGLLRQFQEVLEIGVRDECCSEARLSRAPYRPSICTRVRRFVRTKAILGAPFLTLLSGHMRLRSIHDNESLNQKIQWNIHVYLRTYSSRLETHRQEIKIKIHIDDSFRTGIAYKNAAPLHHP